MDKIIITGVFTLLGVVLGGVFSYFTARTGQKWKNINKDLRRLAGQAKTFYRLEELYIEEVFRLSKGSSKKGTIKKEMREKAVKEGFPRLDITIRDADAVIRKWE